MNILHKKIEIKSLVISAFVGAAIILSIAAATRPGSRTVWEYKVVMGKAFQEELGTAGISCRHLDQTTRVGVSRC
jgi:hypothetical protein